MTLITKILQPLIKKLNGTQIVLLIIVGCIGALFYLQGGSIGLLPRSKQQQEWRDSTEYVVRNQSLILHQETDTDSNGIERTNVHGMFYFDKNEVPHVVFQDPKKKYFYYEDYKGIKHRIK